MELIEALNKYTIVQLLAATPLTLIIFLILREVNSTVRGVRLPGKQDTSDAADTSGLETVKMIAETLGGVISNELRMVIDDMKSDTETATKERAEIVTALNKFGGIMERIMSSFVIHEANTADGMLEFARLMGTVKSELNETNEAVTIMNEDIVTIKASLDLLARKVDEISNRLDKLGLGWEMSPNSLEMMERFLDCANRLDATIVKSATQESPKIDEKEESPEVKAPGNLLKGDVAKVEKSVNIKPSESKIDEEGVGSTIGEIVPKE